MSAGVVNRTTGRAGVRSWPGASGIRSWQAAPARTRTGPENAGLPSGQPCRTAASVISG